MQNEAKILTIAQAAQFLKVSPDTLRRWENKGIVVPQRTKGGSRRYTLLDLRIAKLKRKVKQDYVNPRRDLKIALFTSFLWIFGLFAYHFLAPLFLGPANPQQQIISDDLKEQARLKIASETTSKISAIKVSIMPDQNPVTEKITTEVISTQPNLLLSRPDNLPTLQYVDTLDPYYSLQPLPQNQIPTLIKRS